MNDNGNRSGHSAKSTRLAIFYPIISEFFQPMMFSFHYKNREWKHNASSEFVPINSKKTTLRVEKKKPFLYFDTEFSHKKHEGGRARQKTV